METGPQLRITPDRMEEVGIELGTPGYKVIDLSTTTLRLLYF